MRPNKPVTEAELAKWMAKWRREAERFGIEPAPPKVKRPRGRPRLHEPGSLRRIGLTLPLDTWDALRQASLDRGRRAGRSWTRH